MKENKDGFVLHLQNDDTVNIDKEIYFKQSVYEWEFISDEKIEVLKRLQSFYRAYTEAGKFIGYKKKPIQKIRHHLINKGYEEDIIQEVIESFKKERRVDDFALALKYVKQKYRTPMTSIKMMKNLLQQQGIEEDTAEKAIKEVGMDDHQSIRYVYQKKYQNDDVKIYRYLISKGYDIELVQEIVQRKGK